MRTMIVGLVVAALGSLAGASAAMADAPATVSVSAPGAFSETGGGLGWTGTSNTITGVGATFYLGTLTRSASATEPAGVRAVDLGLHVAVRPAGASTPIDVPLTATLAVGDDAISLPATAPSAEADVPTDALGHFDRYRLELLGLTNGNAPPGPRMIAPRGATTNALLAARLAVAHSALLFLDADQDSAHADDAPFAYSASSEYGLPVSVAATGPCHLADGTVVPDGPGDCVLTATRAPVGGYLGATRTLTIPITETRTAVHLEDVRVTYDGAPHAVAVTTEPAGLPVTVTYDGDAAAPTHAGTYAVEAVFAGGAGYTPASATGTLTIDKAPLSATAADAEREYGQANPALTGTVTGVQADDGITARFATAATRDSAPGSYPIAVTFDDPLGRLADYDVTTHDGTLRVSYPFAGFQAPIDDTGVNVVKAGSTVPVKFSLGQDFGLDILTGGDADAAGTLAWQGGRYRFLWRTDPAWAGTVRTLHLALADGSDHTARFRFR